MVLRSVGILLLPFSHQVHSHLFVFPAEARSHQKAKEKQRTVAFMLLIGRQLTPFIRTHATFPQNNV